MSTLASPTWARADDGASRATAAQVLFDDARALMDAGHADAACPKLEESQRLDPTLGTQLNLALCYAAIGRTASAWTLLREVEAAARRAGDERRVAYARLQADALEPKLSRVTIERAPGVSADTTIRRDGDVVGGAQLGVPIPLDRGEHVVAASAPGRVPWQTRFVLDRDAMRWVVSVPALALETPTEPDRPRGDARRTIGIASVVVGGVGLGVSAWLLGRAFHARDDAAQIDAATGRPHCDDTGCDATGLDDKRSAARLANTSTIVFLVSSAVVVGGAVLWLTAPSATEPTRPGVAVTPGGVALVGRF